MDTSAFRYFRHVAGSTSARARSPNADPLGLDADQARTSVLAGRPVDGAHPSVEDHGLDDVGGRRGEDFVEGTQRHAGNQPRVPLLDLSVGTRYRVDRVAWASTSRRVTCCGGCCRDCRRTRSLSLSSRIRNRVASSFRRPRSLRRGPFTPPTWVIVLMPPVASTVGGRRRRGEGSEYLKPENLFYPLCVEDGESLAEFLERLA